MGSSRLPDFPGILKNVYLLNLQNYRICSKNANKSDDYNAAICLYIYSLRMIFFSF